MNEADNRLVKIDFSSLSLTAFKPRQVLLAEQQHQKSNPGLRMVKKQEEKLDRKVALIHSILSYLQKNGFSKTFKRFLKEAQVEGDNWKASLDLEDVYSIYLENSTDADKVSKAHPEQDVTMEKSGNDSSGDAVSKKKKKIKKGLETDGEGDNKGASLTKKEDNKGESEGIDRSKDKNEKKKSKTVSFADEGQETKKESDANETQAEGSKPESKKKKKKKEAVVATESLDAGQETVNQGKSLEACENGAKKESKKRKLSASDEKEKTSKSSDKGPKMGDEGEVQEASKIGAKESKKRKLSASDENENKSVENSANGKTKRRKTENFEVTKVDGSKKEDLMKNGIENSADEKSAGKQKNGSTQAKTAANAFQRVKADAVKFADERLQDNSYWAKNGAESGYGAKAQEILGQVKGRDFRHEKTKKKRGSYRGGQIDLQSHSIKFNYNEEE